MSGPEKNGPAQGVRAQARGRPLNVLMLLDPIYLYINTIRDYCESFDLYSRHRFTFASSGRPLTDKAETLAECPLDFSSFDVLCIHYSARVAFDELTIPKRVYDSIRRFEGYKILFIQDEYDNTETVRDKINSLAINRVFSCVPPQYLNAVYPPERFPGCAFESILTGYVPPALEQLSDLRPLRERPYHVVYRGREMPYVYGDLTREKLYIGLMVKAACMRLHLPEDIEWSESKRVYGHEWTRFLQSGRATLGTESGANVFDLDGSIRRNIDAALKENPRLTYVEARSTYFEENNIGVLMNQVSPKMFEFIAAKTALILFEGSYSDVLKPGVHYLPLKKDGSNLDSILNKLQDIDFLTELTERTYQDIVASGSYSFASLVRRVESVLNVLPATQSNTAFIDPPSHIPATVQGRLQGALRDLQQEKQSRSHEPAHEVQKTKLRVKIERRRARLAKITGKAQ